MKPIDRNRHGGITTKNLVTWARHAAAAFELDDSESKVARAIVSLFDVEPPCGWPLPELHTRIEDGREVRTIRWEALSDQPLDPVEARQLAVALLHACDEAGKG